MKRPALWLAAMFAAGIALGDVPGVHAGWCFLFAAAGIAAGLVFAWRNRLIPALALGLLAWLALGAAAVQVEKSCVPANAVASLIQQKRLDLSSPHRWTGRLRADPLRLPWGERLEIELESVESEGSSLPVRGGLQISSFHPTDSTAAPALAPVRAGDRLQVLASARQPRNFLDPGAFDFRGYLSNQGIDLTGTLRAPGLLQPLGTPRLSLSDRIARLRGDLLQRTGELFSGQPQVDAVVRAMLLGDRSFVDSDLATEFQETGAYHVLVIAGLHVGVFLAFIYWLAKFTRLRLWGRTFLSLAALAAYTAVVQDRPPIFRAALVAAIFLLARLLFRRVNLLQTVSLAALLLLFEKPSFLRDASFQLSFLAAAIVAAVAVPWIEQTTEPWTRGLRHLQDFTRDGEFPPRVVQFRIDLRAAANWLAAKIPARFENAASSAVTLPLRGALRVWELFVISIALQAGMIALMASFFHRVTLAGPVSNIPAVLLTAAIVPLGFLTLALSTFSLRVAAVGAKLVSVFTLWLLDCVRYFAHFPHASYRIPDPPAWLIAVFIAALAALAVALAFRAEHKGAGARIFVYVAIAVVATLAAAIAAAPFAPVLHAGQMEVTALDVGQGDSIFVAFPAGRTMLVDGGGLMGEEHVGGYRTGMDVGEEVVSPYLWRRRVKRLDAIVLTHAHHDHLDGLYAVIRNFSVKELWVGRDIETPAYQNLISEAQARGVKIMHRVRGESFVWDGVRGQILAGR